MSGWLATMGPVFAFAGEAEIAAAKDTISSQIEAFRSGDNDAAYSHAAPNIRRIFPNVETFMRMVTQGYTAVQMPKSFEFGRSEEVGSGVIMQEVNLVGPDGKDYTAVYQLQLQDDGTWKVSGVAMVPPRGQSI